MSEKKALSNESHCNVTCDNYISNNSRVCVYDNNTMYIADENYYHGTYYDPTDARYGYFTKYD